MGLGSAALIPLSEARERAVAARRLLADGKDPIIERDRERSRGEHRFSAVAAEYIAAHRAGWKSAKHAEQWAATLATYAEPIIGDTPVEDITVAQMSKILTPIWTQKTETASRVRQRIETIIDYATAKRYRVGENPARWRGNLDKMFPKPSRVAKVKHFAAMPYADVPKFYANLTDSLTSLALRFTILTCARTSEVIRAEWPEFDIDSAVWRVPAARMKMGREHIVPLSDAAVAILRSRKGSKAPFPLSSAAMLEHLAHVGAAAYTVHGFRSSFRDWCAEETDFASEVAEMALAHAVSDKVEAAYRRGALLRKRRELAQAWANYCCHC